MILELKLVLGWLVLHVLSHPAITRLKYGIKYQMATLIFSSFRPTILQKKIQINLCSYLCNVKGLGTYSRIVTVMIIAVIELILFSLYLAPLPKHSGEHT
jgi:hypothetical protein